MVSSGTLSGLINNINTNYPDKAITGGIFKDVDGFKAILDNQRNNSFFKYFKLDPVSGVLNFVGTVNPTYIKSVFTNISGNNGEWQVVGFISSDGSSKYSSYLYNGTTWVLKASNQELEEGTLLHEESTGNGYYWFEQWNTIDQELPDSLVMSNSIDSIESITEDAYNQLNPPLTGVLYILTDVF
ncbi:hypothetical protein MBCUR_05370 [Methanobrevibacter curvatus]|uniref:Uncharacterized protein n=2 Tax=Methanobrevibacter curvatus TaxID=49547 RepID=A0A166CAX2_9EURY|nr:hypothetical protein MBCUR_05370 [Methanobrevibacter curvatus]